jgi:hypothetical protein
MMVLAKNMDEFIYISMGKNPFIPLKYALVKK